MKRPKRTYQFSRAFSGQSGGVGRKGRQLLGVDFNALKRRVILEMEARETAARADELEEMEEPEFVEEQTEGGVEKQNLWVEKYAPRGYTVTILVIIDGSRI